MRVSLGGVLLGVWMVAGASLAEALTVSPVRVVLRAKPGQVLTGFFSIENPVDYPLHVLVEPEDWSGGIGGSRGRVRWITIQPDELTLRPGKAKRIKYKIRAPKDAVGELRTQVFFAAERAQKDPGATAIQSRLGTIIYVVIQGTERVEAEILGASASYNASTPGVDKPDRFDVALQIINRGNVHVAPQGRVRIQNLEGRILYTLPLPRGWGLLPGEQGSYPATLHGVHLAPGTYRLVSELTCGDDIAHPIDVTHTVEVSVDEQGGVHYADSASAAPTSAH